MEFIFTKKKKSRKEHILQILSQNSSLTAKKIHNLMKSGSRFYTYQSTFKLISEMKKEDVLVKNDLEYSINPIWIEESIHRLEQLKEYSKKSEEKIFTFKDMEIIVTEGLKEADNVMQQKVIQIQKEIKSSITYWKSPHCWWLICYPLEEEVMIKKYTKNNLFCEAMITRNFELDNDAKSYYSKKKNFKIHIKNNEKDNESVQIVGDYVLSFEIPKEVMQKMDEYYKSNKIDSTILFDLMDKKYKIEVKIIKNKLLAETYIKEISKK